MMTRDPDTWDETCAACRGTGHDCPDCDGTGLIAHPRDESSQALSVEDFFELALDHIGQQAYKKHIKKRH